MTRLIRIELLKLRTTRLTYGLLAVGASLTALDAVLRNARAGHGKLASLSAGAGLTNVLTITGFALLMAAVLGVTVSSGEFHHQTATLTYLEVPNRTRVLLAKVFAAAAVGLVFGAVGAAVTTGIALAFVAGHGYSIALAGGTIARYAGGAILGGALLASLGVALGSLIRAQLGAVIGVFVWAFFVESIVSGLFNSIGPYLPFTATTTLAGARLGGGSFGFAGSSTASALPFVGAAALVAGVAVVLAVVAARTTVVRDIT
jgi:ABC-type transport system involved in multi-copper enzyme maturation permease subunit